MPQLTLYACHQDRKIKYYSHMQVNQEISYSVIFLCFHIVLVFVVNCLCHDVAYNFHFSLCY